MKTNRQCLLVETDPADAAGNLPEDRPGRIRSQDRPRSADRPASGQAQSGLIHMKIISQCLLFGTDPRSSITPRTSHVPRLSSSRDSRKRDVWWCGATICRRELLERGYR